MILSRALQCTIPKAAPVSLRLEDELESKEEREGQASTMLNAGLPPMHSPAVAVAFLLTQHCKLARGGRYHCHPRDWLQNQGGVSHPLASRAFLLSVRARGSYACG